MVLDTGPLLALMDRGDSLQPTIERILRQEPGELLVPAPVSAEVDYLVGQRLGRRARRAFLSDVARGRFSIVCLDEADYPTLLWYDEQYAALDIGLADASVVVIAHRFHTHRIMTIDERHFRTLRPLDGGNFVLLPADLS